MMEEGKLVHNHWKMERNIIILAKNVEELIAILAEMEGILRKYTMNINKTKRPRSLSSASKSNYLNFTAHNWRMCKKLHTSEARSQWVEETEGK